MTYLFLKQALLLRVCSTRLWKTLQEKEKCSKQAIFSVSHSVFYPFGKLSSIFIKFKIVVCKFSEESKICHLRKGYNTQKSRSLCKGAKCFCKRSIDPCEPAQSATKILAHVTPCRVQRKFWLM